MQCLLPFCLRFFFYGKNAAKLKHIATLQPGGDSGVCCYLYVAGLSQHSEQNVWSVQANKVFSCAPHHRTNNPTRHTNTGQMEMGKRATHSNELCQQTCSSPPRGWKRVRLHTEHTEPLMHMQFKYPFGGLQQKWDALLLFFLLPWVLGLVYSRGRGKLQGWWFMIACKFHCRKVTATWCALKRASCCVFWAHWAGFYLIAFFGRKESVQGRIEWRFISNYCMRNKLYFTHILLPQFWGW